LRRYKLTLDKVKKTDLRKEITLECAECSHEIGLDEKVYSCPKCKWLLGVKYELDKMRITRNTFDGRAKNLWRYEEFLPLSRTQAVTMSEGCTPLMKSLNGEKLGVRDLWLKCDFLNPTGSLKDNRQSV